MLTSIRIVHGSEHQSGVGDVPEDQPEATNGASPLAGTPLNGSVPESNGTGGEVETCGVAVAEAQTDVQQDTNGGSAVVPATGEAVSAVAVQGAVPDL